MVAWLKQSTAVVVSFGPFVDKTDGVTPEVGLVTALDHASTGILLSKNGGALTIRAATVTATTYDAYGNYRVTLKTTDVDTLGTLRMQFIETATCLPVWQDFMVVPANVWDSMFGTDKLDVNIEEWNATAVPAEHTVGYPIVTVKDGTGTGEINTNAGAIALVDVVTALTGHTAQTGDSYAIVNSGTHGNAAIKGFVDDIGVAGAGLTALGDTRIANLDATVSSRMATYTQPTGFLAATFPTTVASTTNITGGTITTVTTVTNQLTAAAIATGVWQDTTAGDFTTALSVGKSVMNGVTLGTGLTVARCTLVDTLTTYTGNTVQTGDAFARLGAPAGASVSADIAAIEGQTDDIGAAGAGLTAVPWNATWDTEVQSEVDDALKATLTEGYRSTGAVGSVRDLLYEIIAHLGESAIASTTKTLKKLDGSTTAKTYTLDSATVPTSITETT